MFEYHGDRLHVEELSLDQVADQFGTPAYVYSAAALRSAYDALQSAFPPDAELLFSVKANSSPAIVAVFRQLGAGIELASAGEISIADRAGVRPEKRVFAGPGKSDAQLARWIDSGGGLLNVESVSEARRANRIAEGATRRVDVCLRINPQEGSSAGIVMGGRPLPFGVDEECAAQALTEIESMPCLRLRGIHLFLGTQILSAVDAAAVVAKAFDLAGHYLAAVGRPCEVIDVGPGLGVPTFEGDPELDMGEFRRCIADALPRRPPGSRLLVESGRFLVANAGIFLTTVLEVKESRGTRFIVTDGGMNHHSSAAGGFGNMFRKRYPLSPVFRREPLPAPTTVVGPCCTSADRFGAYVLPAVTPGERLACFKSGAYGLSTGHLLFLSHETPAEVLVDGGVATLIRERAATGCLFVPP